MTDRELLELAAKAAGIALHFVNGAPKEVTEHWPCDPTEGPQEREWDWNPLTDDGDALRLAVKLGICFGPNFAGDRAVCFGEDGKNINEPYGTDPYAATRRAIVRAAAEIGRGIAQPPSIHDLPEDNYYKTQAEAEQIGRAAAEIGKEQS